VSAPAGKPDPRLARADDYVSGHMDEAEATAFEDDLFAAFGGDESEDEVVAAASFVESATRLLGTLQGFAELLEGATRAHVDQLRATGARIHFFELGAGVPVSLPSWGKDVDIVVARLNVDLRAHGLVDVEVETADGRPVKTFREVACDPTDGALYAICQEPLARLAFTRGRTISRVISTKSGHRETVAVFDVNPG
jgi:hypothetical protein